MQEARLEFSKYWEPSRLIEKVSLREASGRILAEDVKSKIDLPPFDRSIYDGYAVKAEDTFGAEEDDPVTLQLKGKILAGQKPDIGIDSNECVEISTGAPMPDSADAVVMVEDTSIDDGKVKVRSAVSLKENVSEKGSELQKGDNVATAGTELSPQVYGSLLACGIEYVKVYRKPQVGIISIGEELVDVGSELELGEIYDVNGPTLTKAVEDCGCLSFYQGILHDDIEEMEKEIENSLADFDVVITSGGTSAGSSDFLPEVLENLGDPGIIVHGLAQKPGKPTVMAIVKNKPIFGLPGYPVSALMVFYQVVAPYLREMSGKPALERKMVEARLPRKITSEAGRKELVPVSLSEEDGNKIATSLRRGSGAITSLSKSDGYFVVPLNIEIIDSDEIVDVELFGWVLL
ncbi:hypothetical protein AKJ41_03710 [candidate division MSBL1 archaeon SCGC-AAA259O05]|uniref:molybdopterin molybdotransferase n=2 Tax=candidate division MSBL1 TaxID=215777 RepID=A0A133V2S2_9EURY|nr:hypothetical protein AKJ64_03335 [candidate division MSBL1 archaeon SCGC-AAA259E17]KXB00748.1 hypothetical protein AKJ41_03710 [candidate division MSBL1 archaeon SCGC-AAA259O05]